MTMLPNYDYDQQNADLQQRQKIALAMQQAAMTDNPAQGLGPGVSLSALSPIAQILKAYMGSRLEAKTQARQQDLTNRYKADSQAAAGDFIKGMTAQPGAIDPGTAVPGTSDPIQAAVGGAPEGNNPSAYVPPSMTSPEDAQRARITAITNAMTSNHPVLQQLAGMAMSNIVKPQTIDWKTIFEQADPATQRRMAAGAGVSGFGSKEKLITMNPDQKLVGEVTGTPNSAGGLGTGGGTNADGTVQEINGFQTPQGMKLIRSVKGENTVQDGRGDYYSISPGGIKQLQQGTNVNLNTTETADNAVAKEMGVNVAKNLSASFEKTKDIPQKIATLDSATKLLNAGMKTGPLADTKMLFSQLGEQLFGTAPDPETANSQTYRGTMSAAVLDIIKALRPASDSDKAFASQASGADPVIAAQAMRNLLLNAKAASMNQLVQHSKMLQRAQMSKVPMADNMEVPFSIARDDKEISWDPAAGMFSPNFPTAQPGGNPAGPSVSRWPGSK